MFGEALVEDMAANAAAGVTNANGVPSSVAAADAAEANSDDEDSVDETGLASCDIELVMAQTGGSRARAAKALKEASGDVVSAIMATM